MILKKGYPSEWDDTYRANLHMSRWPWSDVVSLVSRHWKPKTMARVLELGCGAGANIPFFQTLGMSYYGVDASPTIIEKLKTKFPACHFAVADFTSAIPFVGPFDLILDRGSITHNTTKGVQSCLAMVHKLLAPGGKFIGIDWFATGHSDFERGEPTDDEGTRTAYAEGQFKGVGRVHFFSADDIFDLLQDFNLLSQEFKTHQQSLSNIYTRCASWNIVAEAKR